MTNRSKNRHISGNYSRVSLPGISRAALRLAGILSLSCAALPGAVSFSRDLATGGKCTAGQETALAVHMETAALSASGALDVRGRGFTRATTLVVKFGSVDAPPLYLTPATTAPTRLTATLPPDRLQAPAKIYIAAVDLASGSCANFQMFPFRSSAAVPDALPLTPKAVAGSSTISTIAGIGVPGYSGDNALATLAELNSPFGVAVDSAGSLYIADSFNHRVRKVSAGVITTVAGTGTPGYSGDNIPATTAQLFTPTGVAVDTAGNLYIADYNNQRVRKVSNGIITTVAGTGAFASNGDGGLATSAAVDPMDVTVDASGNLYIDDFIGNRIRKVSGNIINTVAGNGTKGFSGDNNAAINAQLNSPTGIGLDSAGNLYIADWDNSRVRKVSGGGVITTVVGIGTLVWSGDGGLATSAGIDPYDVAVDPSGNLYIADNFNNRIRLVTGVTISTIAGVGTPGYSGDGGSASSAQLNGPESVALDSSGNVFFSDNRNSRVRELSGAAACQILAVMSTPAPGTALPGASVTFTWKTPNCSSPSAYWLDVGTVQGQGNVFAQNVGLVTSQAVTGIPATGTIYVRLWTQLNGNWQFNDYTYSPSSACSPAAISSPAPGTALPGSSVTFTWNASNCATAYWLDVGTVFGQGNIFGQNVGLATTQTVTNIPAGLTIFVRLWTMINGTWQSNPYTYAPVNGCPALATMSSPTPGTALPGTTVTFTWNASNCGPTAYWLDVGTVQGQGNVFAQNVGLVTSKTVTAIPTGVTIYVRLWTQLNGVWQPNDYTYLPVSGACQSLAAMSTPAPGSALPGSTVTFTWSPSTCGPAAYWLDVGTVAGQGNIFGQNVGLVTSQSVSGIPTSGTIYVRLWTLLNGVWQHTDYTYQSPASCLAAMSSPTPGAGLPSTSVTFVWNASVCGASAYWLDVGTVQGQGNVFAQNVGLVTSKTVSGIPTRVTIFVRLWTQISGNWQFKDYTYLPVGGACVTQATMSSPNPGMTFAGSSVTFSWIPSCTATAYWLDVGTVQGQGNLFAQNLGLVNTRTVTGIPTNGAVIYVRLWSQINGNWVYFDYTYTAASQ